jgi:Asp-tRNA(Asn)/Glu-tRNA(Gln) amidotransferase A subunit family amidase
VTTEFATMVPAATVHPKNPKHTPGGSSSGSAAAVAAGMVPFAYGTQTVGSIIRPAAYCGVVGYKPSYGMLSRTGMKMGAETLDTAGVIAKTVQLAALLAGASAMRPLKIDALEKPKLAVCRTSNWHQMSREGATAFENSLHQLASRGARLVEMDMPFDKLDEAASTILVYEMARGLAYEFANHRTRVSPMLLERVEAGATMPYSKYAEALSYAADCRARLKDSLKDVDAIVTPSATGEAPAGLGSTGNTAMNRLWTLLHGPCVTVPAGDGPAGMPVGIQIVGLPGADALTLGAASWVETEIISP